MRWEVFFFFWAIPVTFHFSQSHVTGRQCHAIGVLPAAAGAPASLRATSAIGFILGYTP